MTATGASRAPVVEDDGSRPPVLRLFADVVGQPAAVAALRAAARKPVHAYLFSGSAGSGARPASLAFAAALLCPDGGCGECDVCRRALARAHPDLVVVERTGTAVGVDEARRLAGLAQRRPFEAARQVLVMTDAHLATRSAPALLKTIEEPPPSTVFVLLGEDVPPELATVASRCVEIGFPPLASRAVAAWLVEKGLSEDDAEMVAEGAGGDLDRARLLAEDGTFGRRLQLWRSVPARLDGHGVTAGSLARELLQAVDAALEPLRARHERELETLTAQAEALGERGLPGRRDVIDRQHRETRRWRFDELRSGLAVLARAYRDRLADAVALSGEPRIGEIAVGTTADGALATQRGHRVPDEMRGYAEAVLLVGEASTALRRNPQETLLVEALLVRLGRLGG